MTSKKKAKGKAATPVPVKRPRGKRHTSVHRNHKDATASNINISKLSAAGGKAPGSARLDSRLSMSSPPVAPAESSSGAIAVATIPVKIIATESLRNGQIQFAGLKKSFSSVLLEDIVRQPPAIVTIRPENGTSKLKKSGSLTSDVNFGTSRFEQQLKSLDASALALFKTLQQNSAKKDPNDTVGQSELIESKCRLVLERLSGYIGRVNEVCTNSRPLNPPLDPEKSKNTAE